MTRLSERDIQAAVNRHRARNRELKELIESKGVDLGAMRFIDLHFWAFGPEAAAKLAVALEAEGYSPVSKNLSLSDSALWNVETQVESNPLAITSSAYVEKLVRLAAENRGEFDGWGTSL